MSEDSVLGNMPIIIRNNKYIFPKRIDSINESSWIRYGTDGKKEQSGVSRGLFTWSANGWVKILRILRHKTKKRKYRVVTQKGIVEVTEDHSLIDSNNTYVKPVEVFVGKRLLHKFVGKLKDINNTVDIVKEARNDFYHRFQ